ncbi:MAG: CsbD family protein [Panacagrimonas sp.]
MNTDKAAEMTHDAAHSASADKAKGRTKEFLGSAKAKVGSLIGNEEMEAKGHVLNAEGKTDRLKGEIKEKIEDGKNMVKAGVGVVKDKIDEMRSK